MWEQDFHMFIFKMIFTHSDVPSFHLNSRCSSLKLVFSCLESATMLNFTLHSHKSNCYSFQMSLCLFSKGHIGLLQIIVKNTAIKMWEHLSWALTWNSFALVSNYSCALYFTSHLFALRFQTKVKGQCSTNLIRGFATMGWLHQLMSVQARCGCPRTSQYFVSAWTTYAQDWRRGWKCVSAEVEKKG